ARHDRALAGARAERDPVRGDGEARLHVRDGLVAEDRPAADRPHDPGRLRTPERRLLVRGLLRGIAWLGGAQAGRMALQSVTFVLVARALGASGFGAFAA